MKKLTYLWLILWLGLSSAQAQIEPHNPFAEHGYQPKIATLSQGKYNEFFDLDTIVQIGSVYFNTMSNEIVAFVEKDTTNPATQIEPDVVSRWMCPDPYHQFISPYNAMGNNPVNMIDPDGGFAWHPDQMGNLVADEGDINQFGEVVEENLTSYLDEIGVNYTADDLETWTSNAETMYAINGNSLSGQFGNVNISSTTGQFDNMVGQYLASRYNENKSWGYMDLGGAWSCSPTVAKRVGLATKFVYGANSSEYQLMSSNVAYNGFQNNFGRFALIDTDNDGIRETSGYDNWKAYNAGALGYTRKMSNLTIVGPLLYSKTGYSLNTNQIWNGGLKPGAVLGLTDHTAIFIKYHRERGAINGMYIWDDHNQERLLYKGDSPMPTKGGNFY